MAIPCYLNPLGSQIKFERPWVQPVLSSNGTIGGDSFAVIGSSNYSGGYWAAFDNNPATIWHSNGGMPQWMVMYNPEPLRLKKFIITTSNSSGHEGIKSGTIYGSNDNKVWEEITNYTNTVSGRGQTFEIPVNSTKYYKYYKLHIAESYYHTWIGYCAVIAEIKMDAVTRSYS